MNNNQYSGLSIEELVARKYAGGEIAFVKDLEGSDHFTRKMVSFPSDDLTIYGFMNIPNGEGPFPVIVVLHGWVKPHLWHTLCYTTSYADALANAGFFVLHPNYRNHPPSDEGANLFRVGYAVDILNLLAIIREQGGKPGPLEKAEPNITGLLGHSKGGGITHRVITVDTAVRGAVLYAGLTGDDRRNFESISQWSADPDEIMELKAPEKIVRRIAPIDYMERIQSAVSIHYGDEDIATPPEWALEVTEDLRSLGKEVECFIYPGQGHYLQGESDRLFTERTIRFFNSCLEAEPSI